MLSRRALALLAAAAAAGALAAGAGAATFVPAPGSLPRHAVFVPGVSLAGVHLGDSPAQVRATWGDAFRPCRTCTETSWYYSFPDEPVGAAVVFRHGRVSAVFTLGSIFGWRTREGLRIGDLIQDLVDVYPGMSVRDCDGYAAFSRRSGDAVTSVYVDGEVVYGFALSRPTEPVCQ